mmetsp:Transcript_30444/g.74109  ORF Transcript_30444/g.74109 Transcript_30444/m.74109 type:complete len:664 (-) Transcript_30444:100-2091(-)
MCCTIGREFFLAMRRASPSSRFPKPQTNSNRRRTLTEMKRDSIKSSASEKKIATEGKGNISMTLKLEMSIRCQLNHFLKSPVYEKVVYDDNELRVAIAAKENYIVWKLFDKTIESYSLGRKWRLSLSYWLTFREVFDLMRELKVMEAFFLGSMTSDIWFERFTMEMKEDKKQAEFVQIRKKDPKTTFRKEKNLNSEYQLLREWRGGYLDCYLMPGKTKVNEEVQAVVNETGQKKSLVSGKEILSVLNTFWRRSATPGCGQVAITHDMQLVETKREVALGERVHFSLNEGYNPGDCATFIWPTCNIRNFKVEVKAISNPESTDTNPVPSKCLRTFCLNHPEHRGKYKHFCVVGLNLRGCLQGLRQFGHFGIVYIQSKVWDPQCQTEKFEGHVTKHWFTVSAGALSLPVKFSMSDPDEIFGLPLVAVIFGSWTNDGFGEDESIRGKSSPDCNMSLREILFKKIFRENSEQMTLKPLKQECIRRLATEKYSGGSGQIFALTMKIEDGINLIKQESPVKHRREKLFDGARSTTNDLREVEVNIFRTHASWSLKCKTNWNGNAKADRWLLSICGNVSFEELMTLMENRNVKEAVFFTEQKGFLPWFDRWKTEMKETYLANRGQPSKVFFVQVRKRGSSNSFLESEKKWMMDMVKGCGSSGVPEVHEID